MQRACRQGQEYKADRRPSMSEGAARQLLQTRIQCRTSSREHPAAAQPRRAGASRRSGKGQVARWPW